MKTVHLCSRIQEVDQIIFIGSWSNDKSLNSVAVYEHKRLNKVITLLQLWYTHISWRAVEVHGLTRILDLLMWQIAALKWGKDWNSYPKNRKSFRIQQYTIVESKTRPASPVIGSSTFICIKIGGSSIFFFCKSFNSAIRPITFIAMASNRILWFMCTCIPIWARGSLSLDSHNNSDIVDAGNLMYPSHGGTQAGRVQSDPTGDPFVCGQCSTTGQLSIRSGLRMFQVLPVTVTSNQVAVMHHMPGLPGPCPSRCASLGPGGGLSTASETSASHRSLHQTSDTSRNVNNYTYTLHMLYIASTLVE